LQRPASGSAPDLSDLSELSDESVRGGEMGVPGNRPLVSQYSVKL